jgi:hypothetical protein
MSEQPELEFERQPGQGPEVEKFQVEEMIAALRGRGWRTAADLGARKEKDKRMLRAIAEESEGQIISGQKGYKLTLESTPEEVRSAGWLKSQGDKMRHRWLQIQRVYHRALQPER